MKKLITLLATMLAFSAAHAATNPCAVHKIEANPVYDPTLPVCPRHANAVPVATDADVIVAWKMSQPVILQYCNGDQCGVPFKLSDYYTVLHSNPGLYAGGIPVGMGNNTLYAVRTRLPYALTINSSGEVREITIR